MVSVIIPTLNEARIIDKTLELLFKQNGDYEIIVADGGSTDGTVGLVLNHPQVKLVSAPQGRASQMNAGARTATGRALLFLHADTALPPDGLLMINQAMCDSRVSGGAFCMDFDVNRPMLHFLSRCTRINHTLLTYGDQAIFARAELFHELGGFKPLPIMEDVELQRSLRRSGRFVKLKHPVTTSARRFLRAGVLRQQIVNTVLVLLFHLGVPPSVLAKYYPY